MSRGFMPIFKYFVLVGGCLLALLFATDHYLPRQVERASAADVDRSIRVEFDTAHPPRSSPAIQAERHDALPRESYAMMPKSDPQPAETVAAARESDRARTAHAHRKLRRSQERLIALDHLQPSAW
jgi:hypothetical protein